jgi:hypothetical protein
MIFSDEYTDFSVVYSKDYSSINIKGSVKNKIIYNNIIIIAPNPIDRMSNYSGSGLPFPNYEIAFENTPNIHKIDTSGVFDISFKYPNSFYMTDGLNKIKIIYLYILDMFYFLII